LSLTLTTRPKEDKELQHGRRATVPRSASIEYSGAAGSVTAAAFNLFRSSAAATTTPEAPRRSPAGSEDVGYASDGAVSPSSTSIGGTSLSGYGMRARVKEFLLDSFGKGRKKAIATRPIVTGPLAAVPMTSSTSQGSPPSAAASSAPFFLDKKICER